MDGNELIDIGFGIKITIANKHALDLGLKIAEQTLPAFEADLAKLTVPQLKEVTRKVRSVRGMRDRQEFIDALMAWHRDECLKFAGYVCT